MKAKVKNLLDFVKHIEPDVYGDYTLDDYTSINLGMIRRIGEIIDVELVNEYNHYDFFGEYYFWKKEWLHMPKLMEIMYAD